MPYVLRLSLIVTDEKDVNIKKNFDISVSLSSNGCRAEYQKDVFRQALKSAEQVINDLKEDDKP